MLLIREIWEFFFPPRCCKTPDIVIRKGKEFCMNCGLYQ